MELEISLLLFGVFFALVIVGVPVPFCIGLGTISAMLAIFPYGNALTITAQRMAVGMDSFVLLAIPFFVLAGMLMSNGGIAMRLVRFSEMLLGRVPGSLLHVNILSNMLFGAISGSAAAAAAAVGSTLSPIQKKLGYEPTLYTSANISSCITGALIPPSTPLIVYSLSAGGVSIAALFVAGYLPGILMGLSVMIVAGILAARRNYPRSARPTFRQCVKITLEALPSLMLIIIVIGGILAGIFTATEGSAVAVVYTFLLSVVFYRSISLRDLPRIMMESIITTSVVMLMVGLSMGMAWVMTRAAIPQAVSEALLSVSDNPIIILLLINVILLVIGLFMDLTPAVLILVPILLPIVKSLGMDPIHFGIMMIFNLCIGVITPPVGTSLFVGCSVSGVRVQDIIKPILPFYFGLITVLAMVIYIPEISLFLPRLLGLTN